MVRGRRGCRDVEEGVWNRDMVNRATRHEGHHVDGVSEGYDGGFGMARRGCMVMDFFLYFQKDKLR